MGEQENDYTWVALVHRPGPAAPADGAMFADPRFLAHREFIARMRDAGYLVGAGPFSDEPGTGMTVLRLPGADRWDDAVRLARWEDESVRTGFLDVTVRHWHVVHS